MAQAARPRPTPADYAVADQCMAELAKTVDADWHRRHHDDNREHFAMAAMQKRQGAEWRRQSDAIRAGALECAAENPPTSSSRKAA